MTCAKPIRGTNRTATGTDAGFQRHYRAGECPCVPCAQAHSAHSAEIQKRNRPAHRAANRRWRVSNPGYFGRRQKARLATDPEFRLVRNLRKRLWDAVSGRETIGGTFQLVGCSIPQLRSHLERQFRPGMTWENYGRGGWEVDHIRPIAGFDMRRESSVAECFHHSNLQPLWASENRSKNRYGCFVRATIEALDADG